MAKTELTISELREAMLKVIAVKKDILNFADRIKAWQADVRRIAPYSTIYDNLNKIEQYGEADALLNEIELFLRELGS